MSKAEIFKQLETLNPQELDEAAHRIADLLYESRTRDDVSPAERAILEERLAREKVIPDAANGGKPFGIVCSQNYRAHEWASVSSGS